MEQQKHAPRWLWLLLGSGVLLYLGSIVLPMAYCHYNGKEAMAVVTNTSTKMEGGMGTEPAHQVKYYTLLLTVKICGSVLLESIRLVIDYP